MATVALAFVAVFGTLVPSPQTWAAAGADEIHYTFTGRTSVTFDWRGAANDIRFGPTASYGSTVIASTPDPLPSRPRAPSGKRS